MEDFFCIRPAPRINKQSLFPTYGRLLLSRKGSKPQRNLTANGSNLLVLVSCLPVGRQVSCFLFLCSWLFSSFCSQRREAAKKSIRERLYVSCFSALVSCFLSLVTFLFLLAKAQSRKEIWSQTNLITCYLILATWYSSLYIVLRTWYLVQSLVKQIPTNPQIQERTIPRVVWSDEIAFLSHQTSIQVVVLE